MKTLKPILLYIAYLSFVIGTAIALYHFFGRFTDSLYWFREEATEDVYVVVGVSVFFLVRGIQFIVYRLNHRHNH